MEDVRLLGVRVTVYAALDAAEHARRVSAGLGAATDPAGGSQAVAWKPRALDCSPGGGLVGWFMGVVVSSPVEAEKYIRFQLEQLAARNEHHTFEEICYRIAKRRLSSNLLPATGPVSAGGDQGRDAETYYTQLPQELPAAGGFVGRATSEPLVVACTVQKNRLEEKVRNDLNAICGQGSAVGAVAFFAVHEISVAARHRLQEEARETHGVTLEIFDGQAASHLLAEADLVWIAERYLDLPSHLVPDSPDEPQPEWYAHTLAALRQRDTVRLTPGAFAEVRDGLRHATFEDKARVDLPEWLGYMREFAVGGDTEIAVHARYECAVATLRGLDTLAGVEDDIRAVLDHAATSESPPLLEDASVLLMYWGGAWIRRIATVQAGELRDRNLALRARVRELLTATDEALHPNRAARLLAVAAHLCLQPRWPEVHRPPADTLPSPRRVTLLRLVQEDAGESIVVDPGLPLDVAEGLGYLDRLVDLLPQARAFPVGTVSETFQMLAPALTGDPRYTKVRDGLDAAVAAVDGDSTVAARCRTRALAFRRSGRLLDALRELHQAKINWWHGDTMRGSLLAMRLIGQIYAELHLPYAAKQYALAAAGIAMNSDDPQLEDIVPEALIDAMGDSYSAGAWGDALALAHLAVIAHSEFAEDAFDPQAHPSLQRLDFYTMIVLLAAEQFRPSALPTLRDALGGTGYLQEILSTGLDVLRPSFTYSEEVFTEHADEQLAGRLFSDLGPRRAITFAALGTSWRITCANDRRSVLVAERFAAATQILLVELAPRDPVFLPQEVHVELLAGTPFAGRGTVRFKPTNERAECSVVLRPLADYADDDELNLELSTTLVYLLAHLSVRPEGEFMHTVRQAFGEGLMHKLHVARPYDDVAGLLDEAHYDALSAVRLDPFPGEYTPTPGDELRFPVTPGPGYDRNASLENIRENYQFLPSLLNQTLPCALSNPGTVAGFGRLREEGWLDWHILIAIANAAFNIRASAAGLLGRPLATQQEQYELARAPEIAGSDPIPLAALTPKSLREVMQVAVLAIARRRWGILTATQTPNLTAFRTLLSTRYGLRDDVPHRDLLSGALAEDQTLRPLIES